MVLTTSLLTKIRSDVKDDLELLLLHGAIGTDDTTAVAGDTELGSEVFRDGIDDWDESAADKIVASLIVGTTEANGNSVAEAGWLDTAKEVIDACDATTGWVDDAEMTTSLNNTTYYEGTGSINLVKDAGAAATASTAKTTTSVDFTSKTLRVSIYVKDTTALNKMASNNCVTIRFGSGAGDYYQWTKDKADLAEGWNHFNDLTSASAATTGTPVITACDYTYVGLTADAAGTTWSAGDFMMDDICLMSGTMYTRNALTAITKTNDIQLFFDTTITITVEET